ncbi:hypothetical protein EUGRSUZ_L03281 [Eucalyptus grandis]|uniref:Uncharacterized protein n=1 Tax=Eucalyptus grandis TaxID=71139 RepID=A0AAD9T894_EUCGR|nr:hypothetical protein EUGRSUZ_L03281 [Eucalyptus grandis]
MKKKKKKSQSIEKSEGMFHDGTHAPITMPTLEEQSSWARKPVDFSGANLIQRIEGMRMSVRFGELLPNAWERKVL